MTEDQERLAAQKTKGQERLKREELIKEAMRQAIEDQRKVLNQAKDPNKIYWKG